MSSERGFFQHNATIIWLIYWAGLTCLLHWPKLPRIPIQISKRGLVAHFTTFAILAGLCVFSHIQRKALTRPTMIKWALIFLAFGAISEILQPLSHRHRDWADFIANACGIIVVMTYAFFKYNDRNAATGSQN